jgi:hypothetical protein
VIAIDWGTGEILAGCACVGTRSEDFGKVRLSCFTLLSINVSLLDFSTAPFVHCLHPVNYIRAPACNIPFNLRLGREATNVKHDFAWLHLVPPHIRLQYSGPVSSQFLRISQTSSHTHSSQRLSVTIQLKLTLHRLTNHLFVLTLTMDNKSPLPYIFLFAALFFPPLLLVHYLPYAGSLLGLTPSYTYVYNAKDDLYIYRRTISLAGRVEGTLLLLCMLYVFAVMMGYNYIRYARSEPDRARFWALVICGPMEDDELSERAKMRLAGGTGEMIKRRENGAEVAVYLKAKGA